MLGVNAYRYIAVFISVALTIGTALILRAATSFDDTQIIIISMLIGAAFFVNVLKFLLWGWLNKRYDLSKTYPLTVIFFPLIYVVSHYVDDTPFTAQKTLGILIVIVGLIVFERNKAES